MIKGCTDVQGGCPTKNWSRQAGFARPRLNFTLGRPSPVLNVSRKRASRSPDSK
jgi:hypothetical protein